jgi:hypothetical protein
MGLRNQALGNMRTIQRSLREAKSLIAGIHWRKLRQCPPPGLRTLPQTP